MSLGDNEVAGKYHGEHTLPFDELVAVEAAVTVGLAGPAMAEGKETCAWLARAKRD
jgi:hypothetical protein